jgi:hypothetical protein
MNEKEKIMKNLSDAVKLDNFIEKAYELIDKMMKSNNAFDFVEPILRLMENNPNVDFGQPGPLVHFVEKFYRRGYEQLLLESVERCPTIHTIWMINRIINDPYLKDRQMYINVLKDIRKRTELDVDILKEIDMFLNR